jgi:DNA-binding NarL/FixJ family response regulator
MTAHANPPERPIGVLVVDDQRLMRDGIASLLGLQPGIAVLGTAANGEEAVAQAQTLQPDVILMDVRMPVLDGVAATAQVRRVLPTCQVLMLTTFDDEEYIVEALRAGACGYLLKDIPAPDLARAIQAAHKGIYQLDPVVAGKVVAALKGGSLAPPVPAGAPAPPPARSGDLSSREIAETLVISEGTVKNHISNILGRLGLRDRTQAALYARENGLL